MTWTWGIGVFMTLVLSYTLTRLVLWCLRRINLVDLPNARSSHTIPTPRGGGIAIVGAMVAAFFWSTQIASDAFLEISAAIGLGVILAAISFVDDLRPLPVAPRLLAQTAAVIVGLWTLPEGGQVFQGLFSPAVDQVITAILWIWFINLYNFMDGIDGITGIETLTISIGSCIVLFFGNMHPQLNFLTACLGSAVLGFLWWNRHPARIFLGDVGSVPIGFWVGWILLTLAASGYWIPAVLLPLYYLVDATITLSRRTARGHKMWHAHADHYYQRAARSLGQHNLVTRAILIVNLGLVLLAVLSIIFTDQKLLFLVIGVSLALALICYFATRRSTIA
tara:strand:- start:613 stop:1620 length:1008 start_codon:yes stop_codon:yes gene_type:complete